MPNPKSSYLTMPHFNQSTASLLTSQHLFILHFLYSLHQCFPIAYYAIIMTHQYKICKTRRGTYLFDPFGIGIKEDLEPRRLLVDTLKEEVPGFDLCLPFQCFERVE